MPVVHHPVCNPGLACRYRTPSRNHYMLRIAVIDRPALLEAVKKLLSAAACGGMYCSQNSSLPAGPIYGHCSREWPVMEALAAKQTGTAHLIHANSATDSLCATACNRPCTLGTDHDLLVCRTLR